MDTKDEWTEEEINWNDDEAFSGRLTPKVTVDKVPTTLVTIKQIQNKESGVLMRVLFDSGASHTLISRAALPHLCQGTPLGTVENCQTVAGSFQTKETVRLTSFRQD